MTIVVVCNSLDFDHNMHVWFFVINRTPSKGDIVCMLGSTGEDGCKLSTFSNACSLTLSNFIGHVSLEFHSKSITNNIEYFCSNNEIKFLPPFPHIVASRYKGDVTQTKYQLW